MIKQKNQFEFDIENKKQKSKSKIKTNEENQKELTNTKTNDTKVSKKSKEKLNKKKKKTKICFKKLFSKNCEILICKVLVCITCVLRFCDFLENKKYVDKIINEEEFEFVNNKMHLQTEQGWVNQKGRCYVREGIHNIQFQVAAAQDELTDFSDIIEMDFDFLNDLNGSTMNGKKETNKGINEELINIVNGEEDVIPKVQKQEDVKEEPEQIKDQTPKEMPSKASSKKKNKKQLSINLLKVLISHSAWTLKKYKSLNPQYNLLGTENLWIQKPNGLSRGRGIQVFKTLNEIEAYWAACDCEMVVMKYIERPLLINKRKFDIRHWIVISNLEPLCIWSFESYYIRLSLSDYSDEDPNNIYAHLTNNSVAKKNKQLYSQIYANSMLTRKQFLEFCRSQSPHFNPTKFHDDMNRLLINTVQSAKFNLVPRKKSFTVLGFDLMVDIDFGLWLIEVNSSPSMDTNTNVTEKIVPEFFQNLAEAVCDFNFIGNSNLSLGTRIGRLKLIYKKKRKF
jgi:tubulin monoglycylase TTLL3/8